MKKTLHFTNGAKSADIDIDLKNGRLSISGVVYEGKKLLKSEKNLICAGQCQDEARDLIGEKLFQVWERWHLNDMRAGTPAQENALSEVKHTFNRINWYEQACDYLKCKGLLVDDGHRYGTAWLTEALPQDVVQYLESL